MGATRLVPDSEAETANPRGSDNNRATQSSTDRWRNEKKYDVGREAQRGKARYSVKASPCLAGLERRVEVGCSRKGICAAQHDRRCLYCPGRIIFFDHIHEESSLETSKLCCRAVSSLPQAAASGHQQDPALPCPGRRKGACGGEVRGGG